MQANAPAPGGLPTCSTVAHLLTAKYIDGLPATRQCEMIARQGLDLDRSTVVRWMGAGAHYLEPLYDALFAEVMGSVKIFADETPAPTLEVGRRTTKQAYLWAYARDDRAWNGRDPPAVVYCYASGWGQRPGQATPGRAPQKLSGHPAGRRLPSLRRRGGASGGGGDRPRPVLVARRWSHVRRPIHDIYAGAHAPVAEEALRWIRQLYAIEDEIRGCDAKARRAVRQAKTKPLLDDFYAWLDARLAELPPKDDLAKTFKRIQANWRAFTLFLDDGRVEVDTNRLETLIKNVAVGRKAFLFAGNSGGGHTWAMVTSIVQTCRLNSIDPQAYLADVLQRIVSGEAKINRIRELLPWHWAARRRDPSA